MRSVHIALVLCFLWQSSAFAQESQNPLSKQNTNITIQEDSPKSLNKVLIQFDVEKKNFGEIVHILREKTKLNFIVDDIPSDELCSIHMKAPVSEVLTKFAYYYDYTWKVGANGEIQMLKQFGNPDHLPQTNLKELTQVGVEILDLFTRLGLDTSSKETEPYAMRKLYHSLTPDQVDRLKRGEIITGRQLSATQFAALKQAANSYVWNDLIVAFSEFYSFLKYLPYSNLEMVDQFGNQVLFLNQSSHYDRDTSKALRVFVKPKEVKK